MLFKSFLFELDIKSFINKRHCSTSGKPTNAMQSQFYLLKVAKASRASNDQRLFQGCLRGKNNKNNVSCLISIQPTSIIPGKSKIPFNQRNRQYWSCKLHQATKMFQVSSFLIFSTSRECIRSQTIDKSCHCNYGTFVKFSRGISHEQKVLKIHRLNVKTFFLSTFCNTFIQDTMYQFYQNWQFV